MSRRLPNDKDAEKCVLGSAMLDPIKVLHHAHQKGLRPDDFYVPAHRTIYDGLLRMQRRGRPIDVQTLTTELTKSGDLEEAGGALYLDQCIDKTATPAHAEYYIDIVCEKAKRRDLIHTCMDAASRAYDEEFEVDDLCAKAQTGIVKAGRVRDTTTTNAQAIAANLERWEAASNGKPYGLEFYLASVRHLTGRLRPGKPYFFGAAPGAGKSTILLNQFTRWALDGIPVAVNSIEMDHEECVARVIGDLARVSVFALDHGYKDKEGEAPRLHKAYAAATRIVDPQTGRNLIPLWINDRNMDVDSLWAWARFMSYRHGIQALGVDYLQILRPPASFKGTRREGVIHVLMSLAEMAKELKLVLFVLSQLRGDARHERRPRSSDLKESSDIEDVAEMVVMLYKWINDDKESENHGEEEFLFDVQKNRRGLLGDVPVFFNGPEQRIEDLP